MIIDYDYLAKEYTKCYKDKSRIYMIMHFLKTFDNTKKKDVPFILFPRQQDLCKALGNANNVVTSKPRQAGITTTSAAFIACEMILTDKDSPQTVLAIGNTLDLAQQMLFKIRDFLLQFPLWMWGDEFMDLGYDPMLPPPNKNIIFDVCNNKELKLKNGCRVVARSSGPDASRGVGGVQWLIFDEAAFIENGKDVYASALPTVSTGGHIIMISTPNGKDMLYYETCRKAKLKGTVDWNNFELVEMKWYQDPRYNKNLEWTKKDAETGEILVKKEETLDKEGNIKYDQNHWDKMIEDGWSPRSPWYIKMCQQFNNDSQKIAQELDVSFLGSASNVVDPEFIEMQSNLNVRDPLYSDPMVEDTWIWKEPIEGHKYLMSIDCLPLGEKVLTSNGLKNIEDVSLYDKLINKDGKIIDIINKQHRWANNEDIYTIKLSNSIRPITFTENHPIWASKNTKLKRCFKKHDPNHKFNERYWEHDFDFIKAKDLQVNNWVEIPNIYIQNTLTDKEILAKWEKYENITRKDFSIKNPLLNEEFWWYVGMWLAEGYIINNTDVITTTHHIKETSYINRIETICNTLFDRTLYKRGVVKDTNGTFVLFNCKQLSHFLFDNFGKYSYGKYIPEWVKFLPINYKLKLIEGYLNGDGCIAHCKDDFTIRFVSVSLELIEGIQDLLFSMGIISYGRIMKNYKTVINGKECKCREKYELTLCLYDAIKLCEKLNYDTLGYEIKNRRIIKDSYFSNDLSKIYLKIKKITKSEYTGFVFNFETDTHTFCCKNIATHNCSRGDAADRTAIEILDMDGIDDDGTPCLEQVLEYHGKMTGDVIGELAYKYGMWYGEAFTTVDAIGGTGDACLLTMMNLGYKNLYYDDANLNKYTMQIDASSLKPTADGKLPGFHSNAVRFQMLTYFANMVKTNQIKIRSKRVIQELDTWIYKGTAARIDHQDGCHDDTLTCLAMGVFVMAFSMKKYIAVKEKDKVLLKSWVSTATATASTPTHNIKYTSEISIEPKKNYQLPFYTNNNNGHNSMFDAYRWLIL